MLQTKLSHYEHVGVEVYWVVFKIVNKLWEPAKKKYFLFNFFQNKVPSLIRDGIRFAILGTDIFKIGFEVKP